MGDDGRVRSAELRWFSERFAEVNRNVLQVLRGKPEVVQLALVCFFAEGHLLIEDVPGTGKTSLARAIANSLRAEWNRIQFTPDLLPSDLTGSSVFDQSTGAFDFRPGPVFANIVLGDEINRASPKTQSALLEVMEEQQVTVDGTTHDVPRPFFVVATQNPVDLAGTYRLPEAQLDRFLMRLAVGYPDKDAEVEMLAGRLAAGGDVTVGPVLEVEEAVAMGHFTRGVWVAPVLQRYIIDLVEATRGSPQLRLGVSPRGSIALMRAAQSHAAASGRDYATADDVKALAQLVLAHRLVLTPEAELRGTQAHDLLGEILASIPTPRDVRV